jgi:hypothetical protein
MLSVIVEHILFIALFLAEKKVPEKSGVGWRSFPIFSFLF